MRIPPPADYSIYFFSRWFISEIILSHIPLISQILHILSSYRFYANYFLTDYTDSLQFYSLTDYTDYTESLLFYPLTDYTDLTDSLQFINSQILCNLSTHSFFAIYLLTESLLFYPLTDYPDYTDFIEAMLDTVRFRRRPFWPSAVDGQAAQRGCRGGLYGRQRTTDKQHNIAPLGGKGKWTMGWSLWSPQTTA